MKKLAIIVLNYNGRKLLEKCLPSLLKQVEKSRGVKVILVDNGSQDQSREYLEDLKIKNQKLSLIFSSKNLGFCQGNNLGIDWALKNNFDYLMLLNNDVLIKDCFWEPMIKFLEKNREVGILGPKIYFAPGHETNKEQYQKKDLGRVFWFAGGVIDWKNAYGFHRGVDQIDQGQYDLVQETDFVSGCCLLARKKVWQENLLDKKYFLYLEDLDFCLRAKKKGWKIYYFPKSGIWHLNAGSSGCGGELQDYFIIRNRLLFGLRWAPLRTKLALLREGLRLLRKGRKWQKIGARDFFLRRFEKGSWGE